MVLQNILNKAQKWLKIPATWLAILVLLFILSFLLFFIGNNTVERYFFYSYPNSHDLGGEKRKVMTGENLEESIELYLNELLLGPSSKYQQPLMEADTQLKNVLLRDNIVYLNFEPKLANYITEKQLLSEKLGNLLNVKLSGKWPEFFKIPNEILEESLIAVFPEQLLKNNTSFDELDSVLKQNIQYNFPGIEDVVIFIGGEKPFDEFHVHLNID